MAQTKYLRGLCQHCGGPIEYPAELVGSAMPCPHCGLETDLLLEEPRLESGVPKRLIIWSIIAVAILIGGLIGSIIALKHARNLAERARPPVTVTPQN